MSNYLCLASKISCLITCIFCLISCGNQRSPIPDMPVNLDFNIVAAAPSLSMLGGTAEFTTPQNASQYLGYGGIVVYHTFDDVYCAFDMSCPVEADAGVRVYADLTGIAKCQKCGEEYILTDGNAFPQKGKSKFTLRKYRTYFSAAYNNIYVTR